MQVVGHFSEQIIRLLGLDIVPDTPIYIGETNIQHIKKRHPYKYEKYFECIGDIISYPDYIGKNPRDESVLFVKLYEVNGEYVRVAVKFSFGRKCFVKTLHLLSTCNAERYIEKGTLKRLDRNLD